MPCFRGNCVYRWRVRQVAVEDCWFGKTLSSNSRVSTTGTSPVTRVWMMLFHPQNVPPHGGVASKSSETLAVRLAVLNTYDWSSTLPAAFYSSHHFKTSAAVCFVFMCFKTSASIHRRMQTSDGPTVSSVSENSCHFLLHLHNNLLDHIQSGKSRKHQTEGTFLVPWKVPGTKRFRSFQWKRCYWCRKRTRRAVFALCWNACRQLVSPDGDVL